MAHVILLCARFRATIDDVSKAAMSIPIVGRVEDGSPIFRRNASWSPLKDWFPESVPKVLVGVVCAKVDVLAV